MENILWRIACYIILAHTAVLASVSIKLSVYLSVVISVLEQVFILSYNILLLRSFFFSIRKMEGLCF